MAIINLVTYDDLHDGNGVTKLGWFVSLNQVITYIQLVLSVIIFIFCAIERYPISINSGISDSSSLKILAYKNQAGFNENWFESTYHRY